MNSITYTAFGLSIRSSEKIPTLPAQASKTRPSPADIRIEFASGWHNTPAGPDDILLYSLPTPNADSPPCLSAWKIVPSGDYRLRFDDRIEYRLQQSGSRITVRKRTSASMEEVSTYLLGPVMGLVLRLRGLVCLHASAVVVGNKAVALMAPPGFGKSTLAAAIAKMGYPVLTDDLLAFIDEHHRLQVQPSYPLIRLRPEAVPALFGHRRAPPGLSPQSPTVDKHVLHLTGSGFRFSDTPVELGAVYTGLESDRFEAPAVRRLSGVERFLTLCGNIYLTRVMDKDMHQAQFENLLRVYDRVPVRCIEAPDRSATTPFELARLILDDFFRIQDVATDLRPQRTCP